MCKKKSFFHSCSRKQWTFSTLPQLNIMKARNYCRFFAHSNSRFFAIKKAPKKSRSCVGGTRKSFMSNIKNWKFPFYILYIYTTQREREKLCNVSAGLWAGNWNERASARHDDNDDFQFMKNSLSFPAACTGVWDSMTKALIESGIVKREMRASSTSKKKSFTTINNFQLSAFFSCCPTFPSFIHSLLSLSRLLHARICPGIPVAKPMSYPSNGTRVKHHTVCERETVNDVRLQRCNEPRAFC